MGVCCWLAGATNVVGHTDNICMRTVPITALSPTLLLSKPLRSLHVTASPTSDLIDKSSLNL